MKREYAAVIEKAPNNYCAYVPDAPVCLVAADTRDEILVLIREAIELNIEAALEFGEPVPEPRMSLRDAMKDYLENGESAESGESDGLGDESETSFVMVEVDVALPPPALAAQPELVGVAAASPQS